MLRRLFCYGTLRDPAVMAALLGRVPPSRPATLPAHRRGLLAGRPWAGVAAAAESAVAGTLYEGLTVRELGQLDRYEGADYRRATTRLTVPLGTCRSWIYLPRHPLADGRDSVEPEPVEPARWRSLGLPAARRPRRYQAI